MAPGNMVGSGKQSPAAPQPVVVPAGTFLTVRLGETLSSKDSQPGQTFTASVVTPVEVGRQDCDSRGSDCYRQGGGCPCGRQVQGPSLLQIKTRPGHRARSISLHPDFFGGAISKRKGEAHCGHDRRGRRRGALIGALAGGGKGAAIGALVGGERAPRLGLYGNRDSFCRLSRR